MAIKLASSLMIKHPCRITVTGRYPLQIGGIYENKEDTYGEPLERYVAAELVHDIGTSVFTNECEPALNNRTQKFNWDFLSSFKSSFQSKLYMEPSSTRYLAQMKERLAWIL
ncbi:hypothetical protein [Bacillus amyloliquefaciens]|uniref:hypothetical protein n=2 Tax=Bacillaceae TaxID=186817 RepID=UPI00203B5EB8|nr:hypothetical protein [Bacillus amyloliquefaciens]MEC1015183.1 hypothetical protein [Bacillus amyloliquefaciens]WJM58859.1 hypothetical protein QTN45_04310 [Bacillus amyloliquefaciens]WJM61125.1 hypothetical protein QTN46_16930 [Bacillus amyloliquefaciens]